MYALTPSARAGCAGNPKIPNRHAATVRRCRLLIVTVTMVAQLHSTALAAREADDSSSGGGECFVIQSGVGTTAALGYPRPVQPPPLQPTRPAVIETPRLVLRELNAGDAPFILQLLNEEGFVTFIGDKGVRSMADARRYIAKGPLDSYRRHGFGLYLTSLRDDDIPIGICGLVKRDTLPDVDVGFAFLAHHWGKGYGSEAAAAVLHQGRTVLGLKRIVAITAPDNHGCMAVLEKIGLRLERRIRLVDEGPELNLYGPAL